MKSRHARRGVGGASDAACRFLRGCRLHASRSPPYSTQALHWGWPRSKPPHPLPIRLKHLDEHATEFFPCVLGDIAEHEAALLVDELQGSMGAQHGLVVRSLVLSIAAWRDRRGRERDSNPFEASLAAVEMHLARIVHGLVAGDDHDI